MTLEPSSEPDAPSVSGEWVRAPRRPWRLVLAALTLWSFVEALGELIARFLLGFRRTVVLRLLPGGLELELSTTWLGRTRSARRLHPLGSLVDFTFEPHGPSAGLGVGLAALVLGTALGTGLLVEGLRAPSGAPVVALVGLLCIAFGLGCDFLLERGRVRRGPAAPRLVVHFRDAPAFALRGVEPAEAERLLSALLHESVVEPPLEPIVEPT